MNKRRVLGEDHQDVAMSLFNMCTVHYNQGQHDEAVEMLGKALAVFTRALGVDNQFNAIVHGCIAQARAKSGDVGGAVESARESVRIYSKHGLADEYSQYVAGLLRELEGGV